MKKFFFLLSFSLSFAGYSQNCDSLYVESLRVFDKEQFKESIALVNTCIQNCPAHSDYHIHAAKCYYQIKDYEHTLSNLNIAIKLDDKNIPAYALKAQMLLENEMYDQAIVNYETILSLVPITDISTSLYRVNLSKAYLNVNQFDKAYSLLKNIYSLDSNNIELITNLSVCCMKMDKQQEAEFYLQKVLILQPNFSAGLINMGFYMMEKEDYNKAIEYFNKALVIQSNEPYALNNRGYAHYKLGKNDNALQDINLSISYEPSNSYAYKNRALVYFKTGLTVEACADLQMALTLGYTQMYGDEVLKLQKETCLQNK